MFELDPNNDWRDEMYALAKLDPWRAEVAAELTRKEPAFLALLDSLTKEEKEVILSYIGACEELTFSLVYSAYEVGKRHAGRDAYGSLRAEPTQDA